MRWTALFLLFSLPVFGKGRLLHTQGQVYLDKKMVKKGASFTKGQILKVAKGGLAIARFDNGNTLKVNEMGQVHLTSYANKKGEKTVLNLLKGSSFFQKEKSAKGHLVVKAKKAAMGVRGTTFFVSYGTEEAEDVYMCVKEGKVIVKAPDDSKPVLVKAGQGVRIGKGKKTSDPKFLPWTKNLNWKLSPQNKDLINKATIEESYSDITQRDYD